MAWILFFIFVVMPTLSFIGFCLSLMTKGWFGVIAGVVLLIAGGYAVFFILLLVGNSASVAITS